MHITEENIQLTENIYISYNGAKYPDYGIHVRIVKFLWGCYLESFRGDQSFRFNKNTKWPILHYVSSRYGSRCN